jgi:hypothetical protein
MRVGFQAVNQDRYAAAVSYLLVGTIRYAALLSLWLLPTTANATSFNKSDCNFLSLATESCLTSEAGALSSGSMANWFNSSFSKRHPKIDAMCPQLITAYRKHCNPSAAPIRNGCEGRSSRCSELPNGDLEFKCRQGTYLVSKTTGKIVEDNCNKH